MVRVERHRSVRKLSLESDDFDFDFSPSNTELSNNLKEFRLSAYQPRAFTLDKSGTARSIDGKILFFSFETFRDEICKNGHCFVCGRAPNQEFNNEHVFPRWLLKQCGIFNDKLTLKNGELVKYSSYKIRCCNTCNSQLAVIFEAPLSKVFDRGYDGVLEFIKGGGYGLLCCWLSLIFTKVHLRDFQNRVSLDQRNDEGFIGDHFDLHDFHHIHAVSRALTADVAIENQVLGSLHVVRIDREDATPDFDYCDNLFGRTMMLQVNDFALIYVLDDCGGSISGFSKTFPSLPKLISGLGLRELYAHFATANLHIKHAPSFKTELIRSEGPCITVDLPELEFHKYKPEVFGKLFRNVLGTYAGVVMVDGLVGERALDRLESGNVSFLFDEQEKLRD